MCGSAVLEDMSRLGHGAEGMATAIGIATLAPGGTVAVPAALVLDEVEHYRAGLPTPNLPTLLFAWSCYMLLFPEKARIFHDLSDRSLAFHSLPQVCVLP